METGRSWAGFEGEVLHPGSPGFEEGRALWNGMIETRPAAIARPRTAVQVGDALRFAREHGLTVTVREEVTALRAAPSRTAGS
jgi:hypothetical protein